MLRSRLQRSVSDESLTCDLSASTLKLTLSYWAAVEPTVDQISNTGFHIKHVTDINGF